MTDKTITHPQLVHGYLKYDHLLGLQFEHGVTDCYSLVRHMFKDNLNIELFDYARPNDWWIEDGMDLYKDNFQKEGFSTIDLSDLKDLRVLDCFLISIPDPRNLKVNKTNHAAVYVGNGFIVHHRLGKLSQKSPYRYQMKNWTTSVVRHKDVPDLSVKAQKNVDIMEYILPHKREMVLGALKDAKNK